MTEEQIIRDIINSSALKNPVQEFTHGKCLEFALKFSDKSGGIIIYLPEEKHFVVKKGIKLYDATGNVTKKYLFSKKIGYKDMTVKQIKGYLTS